MRRLRLLPLGAAAAIVVAAAAVPSVPAPSSRVAGLVEILEKPSSRAEERDRALRLLRTLAAGEQGAPDTREASFALAERLTRTQGRDSQEALRAMGSAAMLYPEDPRAIPFLEKLADAACAADDPLSAHLAFSKLMERFGPDADPALVARAAGNAVKAGDTAVAFTWASRIDPDKLKGSVRESALLARLKSAQPLGHGEFARAAQRALDREFPESLRSDPDALLAAARLDEAANALASAAARYEAFANIHAKHPDRPTAILGLARLQARLGRPTAAERAFGWLASEYPDSSAASLGTVERSELAGAPTGGSASHYLEAASRAKDGASARAVYDRLFQRFLGNGLPLEAVAILSRASLDGGSIAALAARESLANGIAPALSLLESRGDDVLLLATAGAVTVADVKIPPEHSAAIAAARGRLGLAADEGGLFSQALDVAAAAGRQGNWPEVRKILGEAAAVTPSVSSEDGASAALLEAEAEWREGREAEALKRIDETRPLATTPRTRRRLAVLEADILFARGSEQDACALYVVAGSVARTPWVDAQLERCGADPATIGVAP